MSFGDGGNIALGGIEVRTALSHAPRQSSLRPNALVSFRLPLPNKQQPNSHADQDDHDQCPYSDRPDRRTVPARGIDEAFRIHQIGIAGHRRQDVTGVSLHVLQFHLFELGRESGIARYQILIAGVVNAVAVMVDPRCSISTINRGGKQVAVQEWRPIIVVIGWTGIAVKNQGTVVVVPV